MINKQVSEEALWLDQNTEMRKPMITKYYQMVSRGRLHAWSRGQNREDLEPRKPDNLDKLRDEINQLPLEDLPPIVDRKLGKTALAEGSEIWEVEQRLDVTEGTVYKWRKQVEEEGLDKKCYTPAQALELTERSNGKPE